MKLINRGFYYGVEVCIEVMWSYKYVVGILCFVLKWVIFWDKINSGGDEGVSVVKRREVVGGGEVVGDVYGDEEEVSFFWV